MNQVPLTLEESIDLIGDIATDLCHPKTIGLACNSTELYTARREVYKEENDKSFQARRCPHSIVKKRHDLLPVSIQELREVTRIHTRKDLGEPAQLFARYYRPLCAGAVEPRMLTQGTTPAPSLTQ